MKKQDLEKILKKIKKPNATGLFKTIDYDVETTKIKNEIPNNTGLVKKN